MLLLASPLLGLSLQYNGFRSSYRSSYGDSSSSSGINDPWFIGISCGLLGLLFITVMVIFIRYVIRRKQERRQSTVRAAHIDGTMPDEMSGQNPYVMNGYRPDTGQNGWNSPTPNPWNDPNQEDPNYKGTNHDGVDPTQFQNTTYQPAQSGFNQTTEASTFVPAFSYGTQYSNTPRSSEPPQANLPVSTIYSH